MSSVLFCAFGVVVNANANANARLRGATELRLLKEEHPDVAIHETTQRDGGQCRAMIFQDMVGEDLPNIPLKY